MLIKLRGIEKAFSLKYLLQGHQIKNYFLIITLKEDNTPLGITQNSRNPRELVKHTGQFTANTFTLCPLPLSTLSQVYLQIRQNVKNRNI